MGERINFESAMTRLEGIVDSLDKAEGSLEESLELFSEGARLVALCTKELEDARLKIETLFPG